METLTFFVDNVAVTAERGSSVLEATRKAEIYIPSLCYHPDLPVSRRAKAASVVYHGSEQIVGDSAEKEFEGCNLCLIEVEGQTDLAPACDTLVTEGMKVLTNTERVRETRKEKLMRILAKHPHACLICAQKEGCTREPCSANVPKLERCCSKFGNCELEKVAEYIGIREDTPHYLPANLPIIKDEPLFTRDYNLCISCTRCVRACQELRGVKALSFVYLNNEAFVGSVASTLRDSACKFCLACVEVCPTGALMDKDLKVGERELSLISCKHGCPAGVDVPRYLNLIAEGKYAEAVAVVREQVPFPSVLGHACARLCEKQCRSKEVNEPVSICALKRFAVDRDTKALKQAIKKAPPTSKRVAILGSGPAGLTAAYHLTRLGHSVTIFDALPKLGGMMRYGVQEYRLPEKALEKDLEDILNLGIEVRVNTHLGNESAAQELKNQGYDAVVVSVGLQRSRILKVEGSTNPDVLGGLDFLRDVRLGKEVRLKDHVLVIGGGNVAMDVALTVLRLGAKQVEIACLEKREEMPAFPWEIEQVIEEGIPLHNSWGVKRIVCEGDKVTGLEQVRCVSVFDQDGRFNPKYDESVTQTLQANMIIFAIGQASELKGLDSSGALKITPMGTIAVNDSNMETDLKGVFACGDVVKGPASIVDAVAQGKKTASAVDKFLGGSGNIDETFTVQETINPWLGREEGFAYKKRAIMPQLPVEQRRGNFAEVELGLDEKAAVEEAKRCLRCDLRLTIRQPTLPPEKWLRFDSQSIASVPESEGVIQLLDENKQTIFIKGTINLRKELTELSATNQKAKYFLYEEAKMFTMRENEFLQQHMKKHGKMPEQNVGIEEDLY